MEFAYLRTLLLLLIAASGAAVAGPSFRPVSTVSNVVRRYDGDPLWLNCSIGESDTFAWTFQNQPLIPSIAKVCSNGTLVVSKVNLGHAGIWLCTKGEQAIRYFVAVHAKARVIRMGILPSSKVSRGTRLEIKCIGYGSLPITWAWYKDGSPLRYPDGREIEPDMNTFHVTLNRSANIECEAKNTYGKDRKNIQVFVFNGVPLPPTTTTTPIPTTTTMRPVQCLRYLGSVCKPWLPIHHMWAFGGTSGTSLDLTWREEAAQTLLGALEAVGSFGPGNSTCGEGLRALLCGLVFPACTRGRSRGGKRPWRPGQLCREHCIAVDRLFCTKNLASTMLTAIRDRVKDQPEVRSLLLVPDSSACAGLPQGTSLMAHGVQQENSNEALCTAVQLERMEDQESSINVCYKGSGEGYRGTVSHYRSSKKGPKQMCAKWSSKHAMEVLESEGYSLAAFPSLASSGQACRNPAGLKKWPFCVPENPTRKTLVRCDIVSCSEILTPPPENNVIYFLGWRLAHSKFAVIFSLILFVGLSLLIFLIYCCFCRHLLGTHDSRSLCSKKRFNGAEMALTATAPSVVSSEFEIDAKSSLLTPNQDYHGKALAEFINPKLQKLEYPREDIVDVKELGRGAFGEVFLVEAPSSPRAGSESGRQCMAMKVLKNDATSEMQLQFLREASLLADLEHDNIVRLIGVSLVYKPFCMLMEYMCHGDLNSFLRRHDPGNTTMRVNIDQAAVAMHSRPSASCNGHVPGSGSVSSAASQVDLNRLMLCNMAIEIAEGMIYLSHLNYVHRDLATRNCLLDINKKVKIADFGLCRHIKRGEDFIDDDHGAMPVRWMPLEAILERRFNLDTDVWSFGVLLWELFSFALQPYYGKGHEEVIAYLQKGSVLDKPTHAPDAVYTLMLRCWSRQRRDRPSFAFLKRHLCDLHRQWSEADHVA